VTLTAPGRHTRPLPQRLGQTAGGLAIVLLVMMTLALVVLAAGQASFLVSGSVATGFPAWLRGPLGEAVPRLHIGQTSLSYLSSGALVAMFGCYLVAIRWASRLRPSWTVAAIAASALILVLGPPFDSRDVFNYINYGHLAAVERLNPYTTIPRHGPDTGLSFVLSNWHGLLSPYGPLFTQLTEFLATLGVSAALWALKLLDLVAYGAMLALVWRTAQRSGRSPTTSVAFIGLNPLALVWGLGGVHYDVIVMAFVVSAVCLSVSPAPGVTLDRARHQLFAGAAFAFAVALKASALLLLPIFVLRSRSRQFVLGLISAGIGLATISVGSFGLHGPALTAQTNLINTHSPADIAGYLLGLGGETHGLHFVLTLLLVVTLVAASAWVWRSPGDWLTAAGALMLVLVTTLSWSVPWYVLWILPFAALSGSTRLRSATLAVSACFLVLFMPAEALLAAHIGLHPESTAIGRAAGRAVQALGG
jgi:hypothetical protein